VNFYKHYLGDYARDTASLSLLEHGAYRVLLDTYYATETPLPSGKRELYTIAKAMTAAEKRAVDRVADLFFPVGEDGLRRNQRADKEIGLAHAYADAQAMRAHMRWHKPVQSLGNANHSHSHNQKKQTTPLPPSGAFLRFWAAWPKNERKASQGKCWSLWLKADFDLQADVILAHVDGLKSSDGWQRGFVPAPLTYLNQRRWEGAEAPQAEAPRVAL
jgi:uncharacterized protein YdaU (DUF1376 family)